MTDLLLGGLVRRAKAEGRRLAAERGASLGAVFDDSLAGDLARLIVRRRLRKACPIATGGLIAVAVEDALDSRATARGDARVTELQIDALVGLLSIAVGVLLALGGLRRG